jgi:hypothetical protein
MQSTKAALCVLVLGLVWSGGCVKSGPAEESTNSAAAAKNQDQQATNPILAKTLRGDLERASLALEQASDALKQGNWEEAAAQVKAAQAHAAKALERKPRLTDEWQFLKDDIDRAIPMLDNRSPEASKILDQCRQRARGLKVQTPADS